MRRALAVWIVTATACAGGPIPAAISHAPRSELTRRLCEPLPAQARECVVSWPMSVPARRRAEAMTVSEAGTLAGSDSPVRAYASCVDQESGFGPVGRVSVLLLEHRPESREALEAELPIAVRWEGEGCDADECALPIADLDGDRLVLRRHDFVPEGSAPDAAELACRAVTLGAVEARVRVVANGVSVRELHASDDGVEVLTRLRGHVSTREHFDWTELGLHLVDAEIAREAAARAAGAARVQRLEDIDLSNEGVIDLQVIARERRLDRDASSEGVAELSELLARAYRAHPSRADLGIEAVERSIEAGELARARETLSLLESLVRVDTPPLPRLRLSLALARDDSTAASDALSAIAPDLTADALARIADTLLRERGTTPIDQSASITLSAAARGLVVIESRGAAAMRARAGRSTVTLRGIPAALATVAGCAQPDVVVVCGDGIPDHPLNRVVTPTAGTLTVVGRAHCAAGVSDPPALLELPNLLSNLGHERDGDIDVFVACGDEVVGIGGVATGDQLAVTRISRRWSGIDLGRVERWLAAPFASLGGRVFPAPTVTIRVSPEEADSALGAAASVAGGRCFRVDDAIECGGAIPEVLGRLYASFTAAD